MKQKQVTEGGHATFSVKVTKEVYELVNILAEGLAHGTNGNDLLKMFIHAFIESAKHEGPVSPEIQMFMNMLTLDPGWHKAFNFADVNAKSEVAQVILVLQQRDEKGNARKGFGLAMIDKPFMDEARMTYCVDDILERVVEVAMKGLYKLLRQIGIEMDSNSLRETLTLMADAQTIANLDESNQSELPGYGMHHDFGRAIEYGQVHKRVPRRTVDSLANSQQTIIFTDDDKLTADEEVEDTEERTKQLDAEIGRPFGIES